MTTSTATARFMHARDQLVSLREDSFRATSEFRWPEISGIFNWAIEWFDVIARGNATPALVILEEDGRRTVRSFDEMAARSDQVAHWLGSLGVGRGDSVMLMLGNQVELWESMLALTKLGAIILPTTLAVGGDDLRDRVTRGSVTHVIAPASHAVQFDELGTGVIGIRVGDGAGHWRSYEDAFLTESSPVDHPQTRANEPLLHYFTSGTTSRPKLVEHTHVSYPVGHLTTMYWLGLRPGDVHLAISSPGWAKHAWSCFFAPWIAEATIFVYNYDRFDAERMLEAVRSEGVTSFCAPPTVWRMLIQADLSRGSGALREAISAGEPLNPEVIAQVRAHWGLTIRDGYGQTEMTAVIANPPGSPIKEGAMGRPLPGCPVVLVDPLTGSLSDEGEICIDMSAHPTNLMTGYLADPAKNAEATRGGYFHTGDIAARDEDGYLTYIGRTDDVFKASDFKISPFELESVLIEHPAVVEAAIVPAPDALRLAVPKAYVVLAAGFEPTEETADNILTYARLHLAPYQRIRRIEFFDLPKTISGKIRRVELRQREERIARSEEDCTEWRDDRARVDRASVNRDRGGQNLVRLDPRITGFLADVEMRSAALPPEGTPAHNRALLDNIVNELFQEVAEGIPEGVVIEDRTLPVGQGAIPVRIYRPDAAGPLGLHVLIHGGGWTQGSIYDWISDVQSSERAIGASCIVVTVEYRLAPEHPYPAGLDDVVDALRWIIGHASELGGDPARISLGGVSAGGNLAAAALLRLRDEGALLPGFAIYEAGIFDFDTSYESFDRYGKGFGLETAIIPALTEIYLPDPAQVSEPYVSPVCAHSVNGLPPSHFITAEFDPTRDTSDAFADRLEQAGIPVTRYRGTGHVHQSPVMTRVLLIARDWRAEVISALRGFHIEQRRFHIE